MNDLVIFAGLPQFPICFIKELFHASCVLLSTFNLFKYSCLCFLKYTYFCN